MYAFALQVLFVIDSHDIWRMWHWFSSFIVADRAGLLELVNAVWCCL